MRGAAWRSYKSQLNADWVLDIFYGGPYGIDAFAHPLLEGAHSAAQAAAF